MKWTPEALEQFVVLWSEPDLRLTHLARFYGCAVRSLHRWRRAMALAPRHAIQRLGPRGRVLLRLREAGCQGVSPEARALLGAARASAALRGRRAWGGW